MSRFWKKRRKNNDDDHHNYDEEDDNSRHVSRKAVKIQPSRSVTSIVSAADTAELERHYTFLPPATPAAAAAPGAPAAPALSSTASKSSAPPPTSTTQKNDANSNSSSSTWQQRMVQHYHQHLYKEFVIADFSAVVHQKQYHRIGLRWRSRPEVEQGKGDVTCGNKHCPSFVQANHYCQLPPVLQLALQPSNRKATEAVGAATSLRANDSSTTTTTTTLLAQQWLEYYNKHSNYDTTQQQKRRNNQEKYEWNLIESMPHGVGLYDYEVNFRYQEKENGVMASKQELVKLRLCIKCAPLLFLSKAAAAANDAPDDDDDDDDNKNERKKKKKKHNDDDNEKEEEEENHVNPSLMARAAWAARSARQSAATAT